MFPNIFTTRGIDKKMSGAINLTHGNSLAKMVTKYLPNFVTEIATLFK